MAGILDRMTGVTSIRRAVGNSLILCLLWTVAIAQEPVGVEGLGQVLIKIDGAPITVSRFKHSYLMSLLRTGRNDTPQNRQAHLDNLVATYLLADEARHRGYQDDEDFLEFVDRQLRLAVGARYFQMAVTDALPPLSDAEVREAFRNSKDQVALRHLFFRDPEAAHVAHDRLRQGEDFLVLANEVFDTASFDSAAGYIGLASYWELDDAVAVAAFDLLPGKFSRPIQSRFGWHILRLDDRLVNPVLTESEFQTRRSGVEAKARIRRNTLEGDAFVRRMMDSAAVSANETGLRLVDEAIREALNRRENPKASPSLTTEEVAVIRERLEPDTELLTYEVDGQRYAFTAADVQFWLPVLEYPELRDKPLAAVGRALRNQVLAQKGLNTGLAEQPDVLETVQFVSNTFLARRVREQLEAMDPESVSVARVEEAYSQMGYRELREGRADWWQIRFGSLADADSVLDLITSGALDPATVGGFVYYVDADLDSVKLRDYVRRAPTDHPMLACLSESECYVLRVDDLRLTYSTLDESEDEIRSQLSRFIPEVELLKRLRSEADIEPNDRLIAEVVTRRGQNDVSSDRDG